MLNTSHCNLCGNLNGTYTLALYQCSHMRISKRSFRLFRLVWNTRWRKVARILGIVDTSTILKPVFYKQFYFTSIQFPHKFCMIRQLGTEVEISYMNVFIQKAVQCIFVVWEHWVICTMFLFELIPLFCVTRIYDDCHCVFILDSCCFFVAKLRHRSIKLRM